MQQFSKAADMGKSKRKNKKSDFDDMFEKINDNNEWQTGPRSMVLDDETLVGAPTTSQAPHGTADFIAMNTDDGPKRGKSSKGHGLGISTGSMKRGAATTAQKKRKEVKLAKALARADKVEAKAGNFLAKKQKKLSLKNIY